jgi:hypothetical protein
MEEEMLQLDVVLVVVEGEPSPAVVNILILVVLEVQD